MTIKHYHLLYYAKVEEEKTKLQLNQFFKGILNELNMQCLIKPQLAFSHLKAWTGIMGITTSHISFHYWTKENYVQVDIYSCKEFDKQHARQYLDKFWKAKNSKAIFINRDKGFNIKYM